MKKNLILFLFVIWFSRNASGQINCDNVLDDAQSLYNSGKYSECSQALESALKTCGLSKNKKEKAYELLINAGLESDNDAQVSKYFKKFLEGDPLFDINDYEALDEFKLHFKQFEIFPRLTFGLRMQGVAPAFPVQKVYTATPRTNSGNKYTPNDSYYVGGTMEFRFHEKWACTLEFTQTNLSYSRTISSNSWDNGIISADSWLLNYSENMIYTEIPVSIKYYEKAGTIARTSKKKLITTYLQFGINNQFLNSSSSTASLKGYTQDPYTLQYRAKNSGNSQYNTTSMRSSYIASPFAGLGFIVTKGRFALSLDMRYAYSLNSGNDKNSRYAVPELISQYNYIDNDMRISRLEMGLTLYYHFSFKAKTIKQK